MNQQRACVGLLFVLLLSSVAAAASETTTQAQARSTVESFRAAVQQRNGAAAVAFLDAKTIEHEGRLRQAALSAGRIELQKMSALDMAEVFCLRATFTRKQLSETSPRELLRAEYEAGQHAHRANPRPPLGRVVVSGKTARIYASGLEGLPPLFLLRRHASRWQVDIAEVERLVAELMPREALANRERIARSTAEARLGRTLDEQRLVGPPE